MSINSDEYFSLKKRYEEAKNNLHYWYRGDPIYYIELLEEVTDEILKDLALYKLSRELFDKEYPPEDNQ